MFDLEEAIARWRRQTRADGLDSPETLAELEAHLRDDFEARVASGLEARQAFEEAVASLGDIKALRHEFSKLPGAPGKIREKLMLSSCFSAAAFVFAINTWTLLLFELAPIQLAIGAGAVLVTTIYLASIPFLPRLLSVSAFDTLISAVKMVSLIAVFLPFVLLLSALQAIQFQIGPLTAMLVWLLVVATVISAVCLPVSRLCPGVLIDFKFAPETEPFLQVARHEAARLGHDFVGTEHLLLGLLKMASPTLDSVLRASGVSPEAVRSEIERLVAPQPPASPGRSTIPLTPRAQHALRMAASEAAKLKEDHLTGNHVLLGLLLEQSGAAAKALRNLRVNIGHIRRTITKRS